MARPLRIEFAGALYHITSRGDRREDIYEDDQDREVFLEILGKVIEQYNWRCHAYCLMTNHYHLVIETVDATLSKGMRQLNGVYTQTSNRRHNRVGHLFQGRYKAILVDEEAYLHELNRYVVLNPVRAQMVSTPEDWRWSSYRAMLGLAWPPQWLMVDQMLREFGNSREKAVAVYQTFVNQGMHQEGPWQNLQQQVYLGDKAFIERMQSNIDKQGNELDTVKIQRRAPAAPLNEIFKAAPDRNTGIAEAHASGAYSYTDIGQYLNLHPVSVGRIARQERRNKQST